MSDIANARPPKAILTDAEGVAKMIGMSAQQVLQAERDGLLPASTNVLGEKRWLILDIKRWSREGCPDRETWERLKCFL